MQNIEPDMPREKCGICGVFGAETAAQDVLTGLHALQHRGQEGFGVVVPDNCHADDRQSDHHHRGYHAQGTVLIGMEAALAQLPTTSRIAIGHVRYATSGDHNMSNLQPFTAMTPYGAVSVAHNGNITNHAERRLATRDFPYVTNTDSEIILAEIAASSAGSLEEAVAGALRRLTGAFSVLIMGQSKVLAARDPLGIRPFGGWAAW